MSVLEQSEFRIKRAQEQLSELKALAANLREGTIEVAVPNDEDSVRREYFRIYQKTLPDFLILVSEMVLHLRAALDHLIFVLARIDSGSIQDGTQFPINDRPEFFAKNRTGCLEHLSDKHCAMVERFQPYKGSHLKLLNRLSNVDKHRHFVQLTTIGNFMTTQMRLGANISETEADPMRKAIGKALRAQSMRMYLYKAPDIFLDDGTPVCEALQILYAEVENIVREFDAVLK